MPSRKKFLRIRRNKEKRTIIHQLSHSNCHLIAITRFNENTCIENQIYREKYGIKGCIYGSPIPISKNIPNNRKIYVLEMNNTTNTIDGIGLIENSINPHINAKHKYKIYNDPNYSRFVYCGKRIDKTLFNKELINICDFLEWFLFYGYGPLDAVSRGKHMKRGMGVNLLSTAFLKSYKNKILNLDLQIHYYFNMCMCITV